MKETSISLAMVALADGTIQDSEIVLLQGYVDQSDILNRPDIIGLVGRMLLSHFSGVSHFRDQAEE